MPWDLRRSSFCTNAFLCVLAFSLIPISLFAQTFVVPGPADPPPSFTPGGPDPDLPDLIPPGGNPSYDNAFCCIPQAFGNICTSGPFRNEDYCSYNATQFNTDLAPEQHTNTAIGIRGVPPVDEDPSNPSGITFFYPGEVFETSLAQCNFFCGLRHQYWHCVNRARPAGQGAYCAQPGTVNPQTGQPYVTQEIQERERGYLPVADPTDPNGDSGYSSCIETCPENTCENCAVMNDLMVRLDIPDDDPAQRIQFCAQNDKCVGEYDNGGKIICMQKPECTRRFTGCCDVVTGDYMLTSNVPDDEASTPPEVKRFLDEQDEQGNRNDLYVDNLTWAPGESGQADVLGCLEGRALTEAEATVDIDAQGETPLDIRTGVPLYDPATSDGYLATAYQVQIDALQCKPKLTACCDLDSGGTLYVREENNTPMSLLPGMETVIQNHLNAVYVYRPEGEENASEEWRHYNDMQYCLSDRGEVTNRWEQNGRVAQSADTFPQVLYEISTYAQTCYLDSSTTTNPPDLTYDGCWACPIHWDDEAACRRVLPGQTEPFCVWSNQVSTPQQRCRMNVEHPSCRVLNPSCEVCEGAYPEVCASNSTYCTWNTAAGRCDRLPICTPTSTSSPRAPRSYGACDRTVDRHPDENQCFAYNPDLPTITRRVGNAPITRAQLLRTHAVWLDGSQRGLDICSPICEDIDRFAYCCHKPTGDLLFESLSTCRTNRDMTFGVEDDGAPPQFAQADCSMLNAIFRGTL